MDDFELVVSELRADPERRSVSGLAIPYGVVANVGRFRERFEAGGAQLLTPAILNREHRATQPLATIDWHDTDAGLELRATLPDGERQDAALADIAAGALRGLSVEFRALAERVDAGVRVVTAYLVSGAAIARAPIYPETQVELRARRLDAPADRRRQRMGLWV